MVLMEFIFQSVQVVYLISLRGTNIFVAGHVKRLEEISKLPDDNKKFVRNLIDMGLRDFKVKEAHAS